MQHITHLHSDRSGRFDGLAGLISLLAVFLPLAAHASTFVPPTDGQLADAAAVVIEATVISRDPAPSPERPAIDYLVEIDHLIKGFMPGSALVVRLPGGILADGRGLWLAGVPTFDEGERLLLFLDPRDDGTFALHQMTLGAFRRDDTGPRSVFWRDLGGAHPLVEVGSAPHVEWGRDAAAFRDWLEARQRGEPGAFEAYVPVPEPARAKIQRKYRTIVSSTEPPPFGCGENGGHSVRWFDFDRGGSVALHAHVDGQPGLESTQAVLKTALEAWNTAADAEIRFQRGGTTRAAAGLTEFDGVNAFLFGDPNDEIGGSFDGSGFLALGGPWFSCDLVEHEGERYHPIFGADVVTQDGLERLFTLVDHPIAAAEELFAHELGHGLGLAHSDEPQALMVADLHADGRGAALDADDLAAVRTLYDDQTSGAPLAPTNLWAAPLESGKVRLAWQDNAGDETGYRVDLRLAGTFIEVPVALEPDTREVNIAGLEAATEYAFRVRAVNASASSTPSNVTRVRTLPEDGACTVDDSRLCLLDGRFEVRVRYRNQHAGGREGSAKAVPATAETGMFWFFDRANIELTVKVLDGTAINGHFWVIYGALSDVEYWIDVTDQATGEVRTYHNPPGEICGQADSRAFEAQALQRLPRFERQPSAGALSALRFEQAGAAKAEATTGSGPCETTNERLCLLEDRFSVEVDWFNQHGGTDGFGRAIAGSDNSGYFWFFSPGNLELTIKVLDGTGFNGHFWVFYGALSDVAYTIRVTDLLSGEVREYQNPPGEVCGRADTTAFPVF